MLGVPHAWFWLPLLSYDEPQLGHSTPWHVSCFFNAWRSSRLVLAAFTFIRRASAWSLNSLARFLSAFFLWMYSIRTRLFLNTLPLTFK